MSKNSKKRAIKKATSANKRKEIQEEVKAVAELVALEAKDAAEKVEDSVEEVVEKSSTSNKAEEIKEEAKAVAELVALEAKDVAEKVESKVEAAKEATDIQSAPARKRGRAKKAIEAEAEKVKADVKKAKMTAKAKVKADADKAKSRAKTDADKAKTAVEDVVDTARTARIAHTETNIQYKSFIQYAGDEVMTDELFDNTTREITVNSIEVPANITEGDYVDIRFRVSSSELQMALTDEIVLAKKEIIAKEGTSIILRLSEKEQMLLAAAAIENTITPTLPYTDGFKKTTMLYATKYVSITQPAAEVTYSNDALLAVVRDNWSGDYYHAVVDNVPAAEEAVSQETLVDAEPVVVGNGD